MLVAALAGYLLCVVARQWLLLAWSVAFGAGLSLLVILGTGLDARSLMPIIALACVAAAGALCGWVRQAGALRRSWVAVAAVALGALVVTAPSQVRRISQTRRQLIALGRSRDQARLVVSPPPVCRPLTVPTPLTTPLVQVWTRIAPQAIRVASGTRAPVGSD